MISLITVIFLETDYSRKHVHIKLTLYNFTGATNLVFKARSVVKMYNSGEI